MREKVSLYCHAASARSWASTRAMSAARRRASVKTHDPTSRNAMGGSIPGTLTPDTNPSRILATPRPGVLGGKVPEGLTWAGEVRPHTRHSTYCPCFCRQGGERRRTERRPRRLPFRLSALIRTSPKRHAPRGPWAKRCSSNTSPCREAKVKRCFAYSHSRLQPSCGFARFEHSLCRRARVRAPLSGRSRRYERKGEVGDPVRTPGTPFFPRGAGGVQEAAYPIDVVIIFLIAPAHAGPSPRVHHIQLQRHAGGPLRGTRRGLPSCLPS
jgi:hypothetical protein